MGLFGARKTRGIGDLAPDPAAEMPMHQGMAAPSSGGWASKLGQIGDILTGNPVFAQRQDAQQESAYRQAQIQALQAKQIPQPTDIMREADSMGLKPGTPEWNDFIRQWRMKQSMIVLGNAENGQQVVNPAMMGQPRPQTPPPPQPGAVMDGHVFLGGDPANPASWKAQ